MEYNNNFDKCDENIKKFIKEINRIRKTQDCLFKDVKRICSIEKKSKTKLNHLIGKSRYLDSISKNNKVIYFNDEDEEYYRFHTKVRSKHISKANVYNVFCGDHDKDLFDEIENGKKFNPNNNKQCFQFALRAFCFHFSRQKIKKNFRLSSKIFEKIADETFKREVISLQRFQNYYANDSWDSIENYVIELDKKIRFISCCSIRPLFNIDGKYTGGRSADNLFINIFPQEEKSYILISYFKDRKKYIKIFLDKLKENVERGDYKKIEKYFTKILSVQDKNITLNPELYDDFTDEEKKKFLKQAFLLRRSTSNFKVFKELIFMKFITPEFNLFS